MKSLSPETPTGQYQQLANVIDIRGVLIDRAMQERTVAMAKYGLVGVPYSVYSAYENLTMENQRHIAAIGRSVNAAMGIEGIVVDNS
jgi:hypothetical protein